MVKKAKLILKGISEESGQPFKREIRTLDEVRESGQYTLVGYNVSEDEGLPPAEYDDCNYCFIEALLSVTRNSSSSGFVQKETIGQTITISNREDGGTNIYNRSWSMGKNNEEWTPWLMILRGDISVVAPTNDLNEKVSVVAESLRTEKERAENAEKGLKEAIDAETANAKLAHDSIKSDITEQSNRITQAEINIRKTATVRFDRIEENEATINYGEVDVLKEVVYYKPSNIFVAADSSGAYWDAWSGMDDYMSGGKIRGDKVYLCGDETYLNVNNNQTSNGYFFKKSNSYPFGNIGYFIHSENGKNERSNEGAKSATTDYIDISYFNGLKVKGRSLPSGLIALVAFYDEKYNFISAITNSGFLEIYRKDFPNGAKYIRATGNNDGEDYIIGVSLSMLLNGLINLQQYTKDISAFQRITPPVIFPKGKNYINKDSDLLYGYSVSGGNLVKLKEGIASNKLFLEKGCVYTTSGFTTFTTGLRLVVVMYFDYDNNYIGRDNYQHIGQNDEENSNYVTNFVYHPPLGTYYCRILLNGASDGHVDFERTQVEKGSFATSFEQFAEWLPAQNKHVTSYEERNYEVSIPKGKNYIDKNNLYYGYSTSQGAYVESPMSVQSNKMFLEQGKTYTVQGVDSFGSEGVNQLFLMCFNKLDEYIGRKQYDLNEDKICTFIYTPPSNTYYTRILLYNYNKAQIQNTNIETAQLEEGSIATEYEEYKGTDYLIHVRENMPSNILLTGASFAYSGNQWFKILCTQLNVKGYNKAVSGSSIHDTAQKIHDGTLYTQTEMEDFSILMIMHVHDKDVADFSAIEEDFNNYTFPAVGNLSYSQAYDYVLKKYAADCYALKDNPESKWYGQKMGKPFEVVCLTHWHDSRPVFNESIRKLRDKWGFHLIELDKNIGFSKNQPHPVTGEQSSILYAVDTEITDGITYGWHPSRDFVNNEPPVIQQKIAKIIANNI